MTCENTYFTLFIPILPIKHVNSSLAIVNRDSIPIPYILFIYLYLFIYVYIHTLYLYVKLCKRVCIRSVCVCVCVHVHTHFSKVDLLQKHSILFHIHINGCVSLCVRVAFQAPSSLCVRRSVRECLTQPAYQEMKQVTARGQTRWGGGCFLLKCGLLYRTAKASACCNNALPLSALVLQTCSSISWTANILPSTTRGATFACGCTEPAGCSPPGSWSSRCKGSWTTLRRRYPERRNWELSLLEKGWRGVMETGWLG